MNKKLIGASAAAILLIAGVAAIASYTTSEYLHSKTEAKNEQKKEDRKLASAQPAQPRCDDNNIVGTVAGGAAGGVVGSQFGRGGGKTAATIGGVLGGAYLGNKYIPTRDVTCQH